VEALGPVDPALEDFMDGRVEVLHPKPNLRREGAQQDRREAEGRREGGLNEGGGYWLGRSAPDSGSKRASFSNASH